MKGERCHSRLLGLIVLLVLGVQFSASVAQTIHPYGLAQMVAVSDDNMSGTARFIGLGGAMTAVGGDPTAVKQNPAGLGIYRHSQFSISGDGSFRRFSQDGLGLPDPWYSRWHLSQVSYVFAITHPERVAGVVSNNIMISYAKRSDIMRIITLNDGSGTAATPGSIRTNIDEYGYRHDADLHYAMNISNRVYWGVGLTIEWMQLRQTINRREYMSADKRGRACQYTLSENATGRTVGVGGTIGLIAHPVQAVRLGLSVESPVVGRMRETDYYTEEFYYPTASSDNVLVYDSPDYISRWQVTSPLKASAGLGLQWRNHGLLSMQYDMQYHKLIGVAHTARVGVEAAITNHWMIEAGYNYSTLYARQRVSLGVNYMGKWLRAGLAYAHSWSKGQVVDSVNFTGQGVYNTRENKFVLTFQWNS